MYSVLRENSSNSISQILVPWKLSTLPPALPEIQGTDAAAPSLPQPGRYSRVNTVTSTYSSVKLHQNQALYPLLQD